MLLSEGTEATSAGGLSPPISPCRIAANTDSSFMLTDHKYAFLAICIECLSLGIVFPSTWPFVSPTSLS